MASNKQDFCRYVDNNGSTISGLNIVVLGDSSVGKTSLVTRFTDDTFYESYFPCIACDFRVKRVTLDDKNIKLCAWDTVGGWHSESTFWKKLALPYLRIAHGIMFLFDVTSLESFENVKNWMGLFEWTDTKTDNPVTNRMYESVNEIPYVIIGTKSDLIDKREVPSQMAQDFASQRGLLYLETSAKTGDNIEIAYITTASLVLDKFNQVGIECLLPGVRATHNSVHSQKCIQSRKCTIS